MQVTPNDEIRGMVATGANVLPNAVVQETFKVCASGRTRRTQGVIPVAFFVEVHLFAV